MTQHGQDVEEQSRHSCTQDVNANFLDPFVHVFEAPKSKKVLSEPRSVHQEDEAVDDAEEEAED